MTTILSARRGSQVALGGDGQVTLGAVVAKASARKIRRLYHEKILAGFAGGTADAFTLFERFEGKLEKHHGHLMRSAVELAKDWRTDRVLRRLEAMLIVADKETTLIITGAGDVIDHLGTFMTIWENVGPLPYPFVSAIAIWSNLEPFGAIWSHVEPIGAIWSHLEPFGAIWSHLEPFGTMCSHLGPFGFFPTRLGDFFLSREVG